MEEHANFVCKICQNNFDKGNSKVDVGKKGISSLLNASVTRQNQDLENYFKEKLNGDCPLVCIHRECRKLT